MSPGSPERGGLPADAPAPAAAWRRVAAVSVALLAVAVLVLGATVARRPARLESVDPADGARLATAPAAVRLSFSGRVDPREAHVSVVGAAGRLPTGPVRVDGSRVTVPLPATGTGSYRLGYHVVLGDGRALSGQTGYRVGPGGGEVAVAAPPETTSDHDHLGSGPLTVGVLLVGTVLTGFAVAVLFRRPGRGRRRT
ncbi:copper resistance CopC family protein [Micromonospora auratinigra]|uniref:CopC domain-containing protein n=1 Tax=Micromonospora auratinigra TaxID=261654 RepID=A0A1A8ZGS3_9ACTN|nr:copper resistance CopC family protein [Micromonospora auratinigra]SBT43043.1 hypothetical protein GA0070611_2174 [Micromonospora auratinigra]